MASITPFLGLNNPSPEDFYNILLENENMTKIDTSVANLSNGKQNQTKATNGSVLKVVGNQLVSATANTDFDKTETGTFTPVVEYVDGVRLTGTQTNRGFYRKTGNYITYEYVVNCTNITNKRDISLLIKGLPFITGEAYRTAVVTDIDYADLPNAVFSEFDTGIYAGTHNTSNITSIYISSAGVYPHRGLTGTKLSATLTLRISCKFYI